MFHFDRNLAPGELAGTVVYRAANGALLPAAGATLTIENSGLSVSADSKGVFVLTGLPSGVFALDAMASPGGGIPGEVGIHLSGLTIGAGDGLDLGQIVLDSLGAIQGSVTVDGQAVGMGAVATIAGLAQSNVADGTFLFPALLPGTYQLSVFDPQSSGALVSAPLSVQVNPAATAHPAIALSSQADLVTMGAVQGLVQLAGAISNANVDVQFSGLGGPDLTTSSSGLYSSGSVPAAIYTVTASLGGFANVSVPFVIVGGSTTTIPTITLLPITNVTDGGTLICVVDSECPADEICLGGTCTIMVGGTADAGEDAGVDAGPSDAGAADAGVTDAGRADAGAPDAGQDAGSPDAGTDAGTTDAGAGDAGLSDGGEDAGPTDAGPFDAGVGVLSDAGGADAGGADAGTDAGVADAGPPVIAPSGLSYSANPVVCLLYQQISNDVPSLAAGTSPVFSVNPALPAGLSLDPATGIISGRPTVAVASGTYLVTAINAAGSTTTTLSITVQVAFVSGVAGTVGGGSDFACALVNGGVECWGVNNSGQLGINDSSVFQSFVPLPVYGLSSGVQTISVGSDHACALVNGGVQCWGLNNYGQLGNNSTVEAFYAPVPVTGLTSGVQVVAAGGSQSCAIVNGDLQCWGHGLDGDLGNGNVGFQSAVPVQPMGMTSGVQAVSIGSYHTCAIMNGGAWCWGYGLQGQLGNNASNESAIPVQVSGLTSGVQAIAAGTDHTCAIVNGGAQCWGSNGQGNLGNNSAAQSNVPVAVLGLTAGVQAIAVSNTSCAIVNGGVQCWGENNYGQLGNNSTDIGSAVPVPVVGLSTGAQALTSGLLHSCAVVAGGVQCWGDNGSGDLGNNSTVQSNVPVSVEGLAAGVQGISGTTEAEDFCAVVNGGMQCWGDNTDGTLGNESTVMDSTSPVAGVLASGVNAISAAAYHTCAIVNGGAQCWGDNSSGDLGNNSTTPSNMPAPVDGLTSGVQQIAAGRSFTCALVNGGAQCWGDNTYGQLGNNSTAAASDPVVVPGLSSGADAISAGLFHACLLLSNGQVECWGANNDGQLGNNSTAASAVPVPVKGLNGAGVLSNVEAITAGYEHSCAIVGGAAQCWGYNFYGQLGDNTGTSSVAPVQVLGLASGVQAIAAGESHTCAVVNGGVQCWGDNATGQLGDNSVLAAFAPVPVIGLTSGVQALVGGARSTCALVNGSVQCWGDNALGELGTAAVSGQSLVPVPIGPFAPSP
jgi:alpha-tubulin suppressor-like RCC1 family protein